MPKLKYSTLRLQNDIINTLKVSNQELTDTMGKVTDGQQQIGNQRLTDFKKFKSTHEHAKTEIGIKICKEQLKKVQAQTTNFILTKSAPKD